MQDVCIVVEGTYPYVLGGVSSWVHNLMTSLKHVRFSLLIILPNKKDFREYKYSIPLNVDSIQEVYIHEYDLSRHKNSGSPKQAYEVLEQFYHDLKRQDYGLFEDVFKLVLNPETRVISPHELVYSKTSWNFLLKAYENLNIDQSFIDFFWTWRLMHLPLLRLAEADFPDVSLFHPVSTGYAGLAACFARMKSGKPFFVTEHGIYTNERRIDIEQSTWVFEKHDTRPIISDSISPFKQLWINFFEHLSRICYDQSEVVVSLFEKNRKLQILGGADAAKTRVIPNGINLAKLSIKRNETTPENPYTVAFVGRVVSIKNIKSFIRACKIIKDKIPSARFLVLGPLEEEPEYVEECMEMTGLLGLSSAMTYTGAVDIKKYLPDIDVMVLTSISEAQPLVILEASICGIPFVAPDIGACSELINGRGPEDIAIGPSGLVTPISDHQATADAVFKLYENPDMSKRFGENGKERVKRYYDVVELNFAYLDLYRELISRHQKVVEGGADGRHRI